MGGVPQGWTKKVKFNKKPLILKEYQFKEKIQRWGFCNSACTDRRDTFMFANMNLLTDKECEVLFSYDGDKLKWNKEYEICVGKKHKFPKELISFTRKKKKKGRGRKEYRKAKKSSVC